MLNNQTKCNPSNSASVNGVVVPETGKQAAIVKKLQELNKWQEEQKKQLDLRQTMQRQMLDIEQQALYEELGLKQSESDLTLVEVEQKDDKIENFASKADEQLKEYVEESSEESMENLQYEQEVLEHYANKEPSYTAWEADNIEDTSRIRPKKPFLRRGEGLKQRFKIDPDELRLNNLPKYKYANAHPNLRFKPLKKSNKTTDLRSKPKTVDQHTNLDAQEQRFQNLLISSKNSCISTPETKPSFVINKAAANLENNPLVRCEKKMVQKLDKVLPATLKDTQNKAAITQMVAWSKILDPLEIEPLEVPRNKSKQALPQTEQSIFELLEQKAQEGSFDMESTCLKEFMIRGIAEKLNESDDIIPVKDQLKNQRLEPVASAERLPPQEHSCCSSDETGSTTSDDTTHKTIETTSTPSQHIPQVRVRFSDSNETHEYEEEPETSIDDESRLSAGNCQAEEDQGDTSKNDLFVQFKQALFAALQVKADQYLANNDSTLDSVSNATLTDKNVSNYDTSNNSAYAPAACKDLQEKTETIKMRLAELEKEIKFFKENNLLLLKAKQEHELQKSLNAQEHLEAMESLNDEKIRMEIYLHDERMKLEDEKRQFEQNYKLKTQGLIAKERKECERLREEVNQLEMQLKTKENNHTAAQGRLRTQIRNLEKEQSRLHEQIENWARENKRLENENFKISREQNNKILLEINRNIAKLAPKQIQQTNIPIPDEGPPTLAASRTMSKSIVATAANNIKFAKPHKPSSTKPCNYKKSPSNLDKEMEIATETNFVQLNKQHTEKHMHDTNLVELEEDDVLKEFQLTPEKMSKTPIKTKAHSNSSGQKTLPNEGHNAQPVPPPTSPRSSGGRDMKREIVNADGSKDIWYPNGNLKKISADGMIIRMLYYNRDIKETNINEGTVKYYYAETNTWHTTYLDGLEILEFPNGQVEHRLKSGVVEVHYPNNSVKIMNPSDEHKQEEWRFPDGTHLVQMRNGDKILSLPNGQKEIHNKLHKRREYPDGTVKIVYPDGSTETRYSNGRVRLKDVEGKLVMDTDMAK